MLAGVGELLRLENYVINDNNSIGTARQYRPPVAAQVAEPAAAKAAA